MYLKISNFISKKCDVQGVEQAYGLRISHRVSDLQWTFPLLAVSFTFSCLTLAKCCLLQPWAFLLLPHTVDMTKCCNLETLLMNKGTRTESFH